MSSIDHLHNETEMLTVKQHSDLLSAQYLVQCLDPDHVCHNITTMDVPPRQMKHTLHTRHYPTVQPMLAATKKETLQAVHTEAVTRAINSQQPNRVLHYQFRGRHTQETTENNSVSATFWTLPTPELIPESSEANCRPKMPRLWSQPS